MKSALAHARPIDPVARWFDGAIECLTAALLAFMPFALGAVEPWSEQVVVLAAGALVACLLLKRLVRPAGGFAWTWAYVPLGLFLLLVVVQRLPLPPGLLGALSPAAAALRAAAHAGRAPAAPITLYPLATDQALRLALAVSAVFVVTVDVYRRTDQIRRLLTVIVGVAGAVALLGLAQLVTGAEKIYWRLPAPPAGAVFVNRNNYCQFMNLSLGAALGLLLVKLRDGLGRGPLTLSRAVERLAHRQLRPVWYLSGGIVLAVASVFLSLSRGGMVALLTAWAVTIAVLALKRRLDGWGWLMCALAVGAFVCVLYLSFESVCDRLASLWRVREYGTRWQLARDSARMWAAFPLLGAGLGTYEVVYPMFDRSAIAATATHAENEYVQMAAETGIIGLGLIGAFAAVIVRDYVRCLRSQRPAIVLAAGGLGAGLLAVAVQSVVDFGLHLPAVACLAAALCGLLVAMARASRSGEAPGATRRHGGVTRWLAGVGLAGAVATWTWAATGADADRRAAGYWRQAQQLEKRMRENHWVVTNADHARLIGLTARGVRCQPSNVRYRHWLNAHRWRAVSRVSDPRTGRIALGPAGRGAVERIVADLQRARALCPVYGPSYSLAGQLRRFVLDDPRGADLIRRGRALAPCSAAACVAEGMLDAREGDAAASLAAFRRALRLGGRWFEHIVRFYVFQAGRPDLAVEVAGDDVRRLLRVAAMLRQEQDEGRAAEARRRAIAALHAQCDAPQASASTLAWAARICLRERDYDRAAGYYRRALSRDCGNVPWRVNFAKALAAMGRTRDAREQAGICRKLMPGSPEVHRLIASLPTPRPGDRPTD
jgi:O-antigen ligase/tetratricopeptide (TPR) repeat protein